jgi:hypothetical protein
MIEAEMLASAIAMAALNHLPTFFAEPALSVAAFWYACVEGRLAGFG